MAALIRSMRERQGSMREQEGSTQGAEGARREEPIWFSVLGGAQHKGS